MAEPVADMDGGVRSEATHPAPGSRGHPHVVAPIGSVNPPLSRLHTIDDVTARPPRTHLAPLQPQNLSGGSTVEAGAGTGGTHHAAGPALTLSPIRGARPSGASSLAESPSRLQGQDGGDADVVVGSLAMVARRRRQSSQATSSPQHTSPEVERTEAYTQLYGHPPVPPETLAGTLRPRGSVSPEAAPSSRTDVNAFDLFDPDTDGSPTW